MILHNFSGINDNLYSAGYQATLKGNWLHDKYSPKG